MIKYLLPLILLLGSSNVATLFAQKKKWEKPPYDFLVDKVSMVDGNIRYTMDSIMSIEDRNTTIATIDQYIEECLSLLNETDFGDTVHFILANSRVEMTKYVGGPIAGVYMPKFLDLCPENFIFCVYGGQHDALKHEVMHMVSISKWGGSETNEGRAGWLEEGLAVFADPEAEGCDGYTLEERYVCFLQDGRLLNIDSLFITSKGEAENKISYTQAGYLVGYLIDNYGIEKLKTLWMSNVNDFEEVYGITLENLVSEMHNNLKIKYLQPINIDSEYLYKNCIE